MSVWAGLLCLLPLLLLLLFGRWTRGRHRVRAAVDGGARSLWAAACLVLDLPPSGAIWSGQKQDALRFLCKPTALAQYLLRNCSALTEPRSSTWLRGDPHVQTFTSQVLGPPSEQLQVTREHLLLADGGLVSLDWAPGPPAGEGWRTDGGGKALGCFSAAPPVLVLVPQHWGGTTPHLEALGQAARSQGFQVVVFQPQGTAGSPVTSARLTEFGDSADLQQALAFIHSRHPSSQLVAVSEGSGSGVLLSYLGEAGSSSQLTACVAISPVLLGRRWFDSRLPPVYNMAVLYQRKLQLHRYRSAFRPVMDVDRALGCSSLRDLEETLFCSRADGSSEPSRGPAPAAAAWALGGRATRAQDWGSYWERNEPLRDADEVAVPVLCLCSRDDPLLPGPASLPIPLFQRSPFFFLALTGRGGHCGFSFSGREQAWNWSHATALDFFKIVADFMKGEKVAAEPGPAWPASRPGNTAVGGRRGAGVTRRAASGVRLGGGPEAGFTWKRSYTR